MAGAFKFEVLCVSAETIVDFGKAAAGLISEHLLDGDEFTIDRTVRPEANSQTGVVHEGLIVVRRPYERKPDEL